MTGTTRGTVRILATALLLFAGFLCRVDAQPGSQTGNSSTSALDDEFLSGPSLSPHWFVNHVEEGIVARHSRMDVEGGRLVIVPDATNLPGGENAGWYEQYDGPYVYKLIDGDFSVMTHVTALDVRNTAIAPSGPFLSVGLIARDPASAATPAGPAAGDENWIMYNVGSQGSELNNGLGTEGKVTVNTRSRLTLAPVGCNSGRLIMCRQGQVVRLLRNLDCDVANTWTEEHVYNRATTTVADQGPVAFPSTLQVGLIANGWGSNPHLQAEYDYIRFRQPDAGAATPQEACTIPFAEVATTSEAPPPTVASSSSRAPLTSAESVPVASTPAASTAPPASATAAAATLPAPTTTATPADPGTLTGLLLQEPGSAVIFGSDNFVRLSREGDALALSSDVLLAGGASLQGVLLAMQQEIQELRAIVESSSGAL